MGGGVAGDFGHVDAPPTAPAKGFEAVGDGVAFKDYGFGPGVNQAAFTDYFHILI